MISLSKSCSLSSRNRLRPQNSFSLSFCGFHTVHINCCLCLFVKTCNHHFSLTRCFKLSLSLHRFGYARSFFFTPLIVLLLTRCLLLRLRCRARMLLLACHSLSLSCSVSLCRSFSCHATCNLRISWFRLHFLKLFLFLFVVMIVLVL